MKTPYEGGIVAIFLNNFWGHFGVFIISQMGSSRGDVGPQTDLKIHTKFSENDPDIPSKFLENYPDMLSKIPPSRQSVRSPVGQVASRPGRQSARSPVGQVASHSFIIFDSRAYIIYYYHVSNG